jgi:hypothetical protein
VTAGLVRQFSLPAHRKMGAGGYKPWLEATKAESNVWAGEALPLGKRVALEVAISEAADLDGVVMLAWVERLLLEAKVLTQKQILIAAGVYLDQQAEILHDRVRVRLWDAKQGE